MRYLIINKDEIDHKEDTMYYPAGYNPMHEVQSWQYVRQIARAAIRGDEIPAILVDGENLLAGTHRAAANDLLERMGYGRLIDAVELEDIEDDTLRERLVEAVQGDNPGEDIQEIWDDGR